jgi:hypothetical protein
MENFCAVAVAGPELASADAVGAKFAPDDLLSHADSEGTASESANNEIQLFFRVIIGSPFAGEYGTLALAFQENYAPPPGSSGASAMCSCVSLVSELTNQRACQWDCHRTLTVTQRARAVEAIYLFDDVLRGWAYEPLYEIHGDLLWREAQRANDPMYRKVAVRFGECIFRRLVGGTIHEALHASFGDVTKANYGMPFGLPYSVPLEVADRDVEAYLAPHNFAEARAFVGVPIVGKRMFGIDWDVRTARDVGTYGFVGGNALLPPITGYRAVAHLDPVHHADRYLPKARGLEAEARAWFTEQNLAALERGFRDAATIGHRSRSGKYPAPADVARILPKKIGRNDPCPCGSAKKVKACCGDRAAVGPAAQTFAR